MLDGGVSAEFDERVRMLDGLVRYRFGDNPALMEGWSSAPGCDRAVQAEGGAGAGGPGRR